MFIFHAATDARIVNSSPHWVALNEGSTTSLGRELFILHISGTQPPSQRHHAATTNTAHTNATSAATVAKTAATWSLP